MPQSPVPSKSRISVDTWAVILALLAVVLIRTGILKAIPW
jgi:hypothetical protein